MTVLTGLRVIEYCTPLGTFAGKLLADMGADVVKVEPLAGDELRRVVPFLADEPGPERSLAFWHYNTSKRSIALDLERDEGRELFRRLAASADVVLESQAPGEMARLGLDHPELCGANPRLIYVSVTPFGRSGPRSGEQATDLTILAAGGPVWNNGYDDHTLPPVRGGGNQGYHTASHYAVMSALVALISRELTGEGQHIDVNAHAAANVTTEAGSYTWLVAQQTVQRQTGRHAGVAPSMPTQIQCADRRWVNSGIPPRRPHEFGKMLDWLDTLGLREEFHGSALLELGQEKESFPLYRIAEDPEIAAIFGSGREALTYIAARIPAYDFFTGGQQRGFQVGIIYSPEETFSDPHFVARGWPTTVEHPELGRTFTYPGAPYAFEKTPWRIRRRAPLLGEDSDAVLAELDLDGEAQARLRAAGVIR
ncbi:MAG: CaiB/BaiF CoA transferase family protein [Dehalococcoidia bacterium]